MRSALFAKVILRSATVTVSISRHAEGKELTQTECSVGWHVGHIKLFQAKSAAKVDESSSLQVNITRAEAMMCQLTAEANWPLASMDKLTAAVKVMFPDSKIAAVRPK